MSGIYVVGQSGTVYQAVGTAVSEAVAESLTAFAGYNNVLGSHCLDVAQAADAVSPILHTTAQAQDTLRGQDATGFGNIYFSIFADSAQVAASPTGNDIISQAVQDVVWNLSGIYPIAETYNSLSELLVASCELLLTFQAALSETVGISDAFSEALSVVIESTFVLAARAGVSLVGQSVLQEYIRAVGAILLTFPKDVLESVTITTALLQAHLLTLPVAEYARFMGVLKTQYTALPGISEQLSAAEHIISGLGIQVDDLITLDALVNGLLNAQNLVKESLQAASDLSATRVLVLAVSDSAVVIDPPSGESFTPMQLLNALVTEQINFSIGWVANDGIYEGYVVNTNTNAVSQYQGWNFNSFAEFYGQYLGASATQGLAQLGGSADGANPILATLQTAVTDFGSGHEKRVRSAYLGIAAEGTCYLQVLTDDNVERTYQLVSNAPGLGTERVDMARGVKSRYWSFSIQSVDGSAWRLDNLEVLPVILSRRVR